MAMKPLNEPIVPETAVSPWDQGGEGELDYMHMPGEMLCYRTPQVAFDRETSEMATGMALLNRLQDTLDAYDGGESRIDISGLDDANRRLVDQVLSEGEVSIVCTVPKTVQIQEAVLTGVWRVRETEGHGEVLRDTIVVGPCPTEVTRALADRRGRNINIADAALPDGVMNAPTLLHEIAYRSRQYRVGDPAHVVNLTLLPQTPEDLALLEASLGQGPVSMLSRGYGSCRILSTSVDYVWWLRYFNSSEQLILNTIEIVDVPLAARAASEDIADSGVRLREIIEAYA